MLTPNESHKKRIGSSKKSIGCLKRKKSLGLPKEMLDYRFFGPPCRFAILKLNSTFKNFQNKLNFADRTCWTLCQTLSSCAICAPSRKTTTQWRQRSPNLWKVDTNESWPTSKYLNDLVFIFLLLDVLTTLSLLSAIRTHTARLGLLLLFFVPSSKHNRTFLLTNKFWKNRLNFWDRNNR